MLPDIKADNRLLTGAERGILVRRSGYFQLTVVENQPGPAAATNW
jgi:hypothetical protein